MNDDAVSLTKSQVDALALMLIHEHLWDVEDWADRDLMPFLDDMSYVAVVDSIHAYRSRLHDHIEAVEMIYGVDAQYLWDAVR